MPPMAGTSGPIQPFSGYSGHNNPELDFTASSSSFNPAPHPAVAASSSAPSSQPTKSRARSRRKDQSAEKDDGKRRCVSTACLECRRRKSKCDGNLPACAACAQVYETECIYDPNSDHRRKGVYKNDVDLLKTQKSQTLATIVQALLNYGDDEVQELVKDVRSCESLDAVADRILAKEHGLESELDDAGSRPLDSFALPTLTFESKLFGKMGDLRLDEGSVRYIGGTSNLIHVASEEDTSDVDEFPQQDNAITSWTQVTDDPELIRHLLNMYFTWHYTFFTTLSKSLFYRDFSLGRSPASTRRRTHYCSPLLVNAMLALGCHFTSRPGSRQDPSDSATAGDHFFKEAKRLIMMNDEHEKPRLTTVQALALMSVREAGCGREAKGWVYSGMSFRMATDMGLNLDSGRLTANKHVNGDEAEEDVRRITFWGCYLFDKCWSNYLGRLPQLSTSMVTVPKYEVFPDEDAAQWSAYTDSGFITAHSQPARTRAVALQISKLCEISNDIMKYFYDPTDMTKTKGKNVELKKLSEMHTRLESWRRELPAELEPKEGGLSSVLVMHMFFQLLYIHLFRPFLRYTQETSPLPPNVSPRKLCTQAAQMISKLLRLYKRSHGLRQICNIAVYIAHSACTIHILNLPEKDAKRDIVHGLKHLEEIAESWLCARRTLRVLSTLARRWNVELPEEAQSVLMRTDAKFSNYLPETRSPSNATDKTPEGTTPSMFVENHLWQTSDLQAPVASMSAPMTLPPNIAHTSPSAMPQNYIAHTAVSSSDIPMLAQTMSPNHPTPISQVMPGITSQSSKRPHDSPSRMFGGVEQLLKDSQEWVYRDQAQIASGFGNWNSPMDADPATWILNRSMQRPTSNPPQFTNTSPVHEAHAPPQTMNGPTASQPMTPQMNFTMGGPSSTPAPAVDAFAMGNWLNGATGMSGYNEDEWYQ